MLNGKERDVPLSQEARQIFEEKLKTTQRGDRLFIDVRGSGEKTHEVVQKAEKWLEGIRGRAETQEGRDIRYWYNGQIRSSRTMVSDIHMSRNAWIACNKRAFPGMQRRRSFRKF